MANPLEARREQMFPKLTPDQVRRLGAYGKRVRVVAGEVLAEPGDRHGRLLVVLSGSIEIVLPGMAGETLVTVHTAGDFAGEMSALRGAGGAVRVRVREDGEVIAIEHDELRRLVQADAELSELFMRAFILRRMGLIASQQGDVVLIGSSHSAATLRLRQFLGRNGFPYVSIDVDRDPDVAALLERFHIGVEDIPVVVCRGEHVLKNPSNAALAECLRMNPEIDDATVRDLVVIGAGPAGLAAAVYGASEGLDVLVLETTAPGGQAGTSSKIENYLGFPTGISGMALAGRALVQAQKFGADVSVASTVVRLLCHRRPYRIELANGRVVHARTIVVATGAEYRRIDIENLSRFVGTGVYYAATHLEAQLCRDEEVIVVGGGNSAGQAAVFLAGACRHVHLLVRSSGLAATMSRYLIRRIEESSNITLRPLTEITAMAGNGQLEQVTWRSSASGEAEVRDIGQVFLMTGAVPNTRWLEGWAALDEKGFVRTGLDIRAEDLAASNWPFARPPHLLETTRPGIFAVGDVRSGSVKRVAAAVGEGSASVQFVHRSLQE
ncbi:MAG: FAD-dependent oxidoreductase [Burkholderiales bacterium]